MRIVTRPDFDGVVCAVLLYETENITEPVNWVEPDEIQKGSADIQQGDIIANLPYHEKCALWFDHHYTNQIDKPFKGSFKIAPSAAGVVFEYYRNELQSDYSELIKETDKIDSANLSKDEVLCPENYPYVLLSMTFSGHNRADELYWNRLVDLLGRFEIKRIHDDPEVKERSKAVIERNEKYKEYIKEYTELRQHVSITDFRSLPEAPSGNRFLVYLMYPESVVNMKIRYDSEKKEKIIVNLGHSIFNPNCNVNVGELLSRFGGGGHRGAGSCSFGSGEADNIIPAIIDTLLRN
ncbi:MAG: exopolyphosphatase [Desulfobacteraceae bacterium]|nr:exopolyphosphatase [Desulfobacteraceae bacterium]